MSNFARIVVLVTALASLFAVMSSTAGAVTFTNSGSTAFTATGGPFSLSVNSGANVLACTGSSMTGTVPPGLFSGMDGTAVWPDCNLIGQAGKVDCSYALTPNLFGGGGTTVGSVDLHCIVRLTAADLPLCTITGQTPGGYDNPIGTSKGRITLFSSSSLVVSNFFDASCSAFGVPTGTTRTGSLTAQTITITNGTPTTLGPVVTSP